jgi:hypothetical protein
MEFMVTFIVFLMLVYSNVLIYTVSLLCVSVILLVHMVSTGYLRILIFLLILVVYVGAVIILIGYICAICPNVFFTPSYYFLFFSPLLFLVFFFSGLSIYPISNKSNFLLDYFLRAWGIHVFLFIVLMLFVTLLIVTSQYVSPQGPLRSA